MQLKYKYIQKYKFKLNEQGKHEIFDAIFYISHARKEHLSWCLIATAVLLSWSVHHAEIGSLSPGGERLKNIT